MIFKTKASLNCVQCGYQKTFDAESNVYATDLRDVREITAWGEDSIQVSELKFEGVCPDCKYNKAA